MKRALAIAVALCTVGFAGFSQISIKGSWSASVCLLPSTTVTSTLGLTYSVAGFDFGTSFRFATTGLDRVSFTAKGAAGPFTIDATSWFNPATPEYMGAMLTTSFDFVGVNLGLRIMHWDTDYNACFFSTACWPFGPFYEKDKIVLSPCVQTGAYGMLYRFTGTVAPVTVSAYFVDCCTGIQFYALWLTLKDVDLCCGLKYTSELLFTKAGFQYLKLTGLNIPLCCGVSFDFGVQFGVDYKSIIWEPKFAGLGEACIKIYGEPIWGYYFWSGINIYGFAIKCTIADCNYIELIEALNPTWMNNNVLGSADQLLTACGEFEILKLGFCGAGCCGGKYDVTLRIFFGTNGGIFDITRIGYTVNVPVMANFTLNLTGRIAVSTCTTNSFCIGWTFTF